MTVQDAYLKIAHRPKTVCRTVRLALFRILVTSEDCCARFELFGMEVTSAAAAESKKLCSAYDTALFKALCSEVVKQRIYRTEAIMAGWKSVATTINEW